jgi:tripartite ATP-independent transporter DctM subunit
MLRLGYDDRLAIGVVCAGGALGTMVPPSIVLIIYGLIAQVSVSDLFAAALIPALILAGSYAAYIIIRVNLDPSLAPAIEDVLNDQNEESGNVTLIGVLLPVLVAFMVLGSIYGGIASVTESASLGAAGMILSTIVRREFTWTLLRDSLRQTLQTCGMIIWIGIGASALIGVYSLLGGIKFVEQTLLGLDLAPVALILAMMGLLIILGLFLDWVGIALLTMPVFLPIIKTLGYDPVWFGILFCINMQVSFLSPPFGPAAFFLKSVAPPEITLGRIFSSLWPFILIQVAVLLLVLFVPEITEILR